jgi:hypothetical protein
MNSETVIQAELVRLISRNGLDLHGDGRAQ